MELNLNNTFKNLVAISHIAENKPLDVSFYHCVVFIYIMMFNNYFSMFSLISLMIYHPTYCVYSEFSLNFATPQLLHMCYIVKVPLSTTTIST